MKMAGWNSVFALSAVLVAAGHELYAQGPVPAPSGGKMADSSPAPPLNGPTVVLDRVVAVINKDVILESDIQEEMHYAILQPIRADAGENSPQNALVRLIDRDLILQQMDLSGISIPAPTDQQVESEISDLRKHIPDCVMYKCETEAGWQAFLKANDLSEPAVFARWRQILLVLSFIQARFGAGIRITDPEIKRYYDEVIVPQFAKRELKPPALQAMSGRIRQVLLQQRVNGLLEDWLKSLKGEGSVTILDPKYRSVVAASANGGELGMQP